MKAYHNSNSLSRPRLYKATRQRPFEEFFSRINFPYPGDDFIPVVECDKDVTVKFMSDHGKTDNAQASAFRKYLKREGVRVDDDDVGDPGRIVVLATSDWNKLFPALLLEPGTGY